MVAVPGDYPRVHHAWVLRPDVTLDQRRGPGDVDTARRAGTPAGYTYQSYIQYRQYLYYMPIPYWTTGGEWVLKDDGYGRLVYICRA